MGGGAMRLPLLLSADTEPELLLRTEVWALGLTEPEAWVAALELLALLLVALL